MKQKQNKSRPTNIIEVSKMIAVAFDLNDVKWPKTKKISTSKQKNSIAHSKNGVLSSAKLDTVADNVEAKIDS